MPHASSHANRAIRNVTTRATDAVRRFRKAEKGVAGVEFAVILPLMLIMWLGTYEITQAISASRRVTMVSRTLADLTSRDTSTTPNELKLIFQAANSVFAPMDASTVKMRLTSVKRNATNQDMVIWSRVPDGQTTPAAHPKNIPMPQMPNTILSGDGETVVVAEVTYDYYPIAKFVTSDYMKMPTKISMKQVTYMIPR
ncbi:MAG: TadE/TadG family type IV pilus assembly protein, partial [Beijerinckiaceae bacterium]